MKQKLSGLIQPLRNDLYLLRLLWSISPIHVFFAFFIKLADFAQWVFYSVIFMRYFFGDAGAPRSFHDAAAFLLITAAVMSLTGLLFAYYEKRLVPITDQEIHYQLNLKLFEKAAGVDISCYEDTTFYDQYTKATTEAFSRAVSVINAVSTVLGAFLASLYVISEMMRISPIAGAFALLPMAGNLIFDAIVNKLYYKRDMDEVPYRRRQEYVNRVMYLQKYAKEMRLTNIFKVCRRTYEQAYEGLLRVNDKHWKKLTIMECVKSVLNFPLVFEGLWLYAAYAAIVQRSITMGDFVVLASAIVSTTWMLISFSSSLVTCYKDGLYIGNLRQFLSHEARIPETWDGLPVPDAIESLEVRGVTFCYPGAKADTLHDLSLTVRAGERVALVGHNGAGKTTLAKLLMRLYDPDEGCILLNGTDIRRYNLRAYRDKIGAVFQDFQVLSMSVLENVLMGPPKNPEDRARAVQALRDSGVYEKAVSLPQGVDTVLTREFDDEGALLSGGELQKIAAARAFARRCPIVLLDEPSSALDPIAEYEMYETIMRLSAREDGGQKKLALLISHRLSTAAQASRIYLLENGAVREEGTHETLMGLGGAYADMFHKQAENYLQPAPAGGAKL